MDYEITEVIAVKDNAYQGKAGIRFKVAGVEHQLSTLTSEKEKYVVGAVVKGTITSKEKDGRTFYNFNEDRKATHVVASPSYQPTGDLNRLELKLDRALATLATIGGEVTGIKGVLGDILQKVDPMDFPKKDDLDAPPF